MPEGSWDQVGPHEDLLDQARGPLASPGPINLRLDFLRLADPFADMLDLPAFVGLPEDSPGPALDSSDPAGSHMASQPRRPLTPPPLHNLKTAICKNMRLHGGAKVGPVVQGLEAEQRPDSAPYQQLNIF
jgi:hypothetical protein